MRRVTIYQACESVLADNVLDVHASRKGSSAKGLYAQGESRDYYQGNLLSDSSRRDVQAKVRNQSLGPHGMKEDLSETWNKMTFIRAIIVQLLSAASFPALDHSI